MWQNDSYMSVVPISTFSVSQLHVLDGNHQDGTVHLFTILKKSFELDEITHCLDIVALKSN